MHPALAFDVWIESPDERYQAPLMAAIIVITKLGMSGAKYIVENLPKPIVENQDWDDALAVKRMLEEGYFPPRKQWPRPEGACCVVSIREAR